jgi:hypothetical protein
MVIPPIIEVGGILLSSDILTERFCCDLSKCKGICCVEGDAGAPVTLDEIGEIENLLDDVWPDLSAQAQAVIDQQGVAYTDREGDLVTSIVGGKDCVFTYYGDIEDWETHEPITGCCLCALEKACRSGNRDSQSSILNSQFVKPISCALYPIREKRFSDGTVALNYHRWAVCVDAVRKGQELDLPVYKFLKNPLIRRFGEAWYQELCDVAEELKKQSLL